MEQVDLLTFFKQLLMSRTVWSGIITIICGVLVIVISPEGHTTLVEVGLTIATCITGISTIVFRYKATKVLGAQSLPKTDIK